MFLTTNELNVGSQIFTILKSGKSKQQDIHNIIAIDNISSGTLRVDLQ